MGVTIFKLTNYLQYFFIPEEDRVFFSRKVGHAFPNLPLDKKALVTLTSHKEGINLWSVLIVYCSKY